MHKLRKKATHAQTQSRQMNLNTHYYYCYYYWQIEFWTQAKSTFITSYTDTPTWHTNFFFFFLNVLLYVCIWNVATTFLDGHCTGFNEKRFVLIMWRKGRERERATESIWLFDIDEEEGKTRIFDLGLDYMCLDKIAQVLCKNSLSSAVLNKLLFEIIMLFAHTLSFSLSLSSVFPDFVEWT